MFAFAIMSMYDMKYKIFVTHDRLDGLDKLDRLDRLGLEGF